MRKLSNFRIEVVTGILAAVAFVGILLVGGVPSGSVAEGATAFKDGFQALSAAVVGKDKQENEIFEGEWLSRELERQAALTAGDSRFDHCKGRSARPAVTVQREKRLNSCPMNAQKASLASNGTSGCDGDKKGGGKTSDGVRSEQGVSLAAVGDSGCDGDKKGGDKTSDGVRSEQGISLAAMTDPGCDGDKKGGDKTSSGVCPLSGKPVQAPNVTTDAKSKPLLAMAK